MRLEHYPTDKLKKEIIAVLKKHIDISHYRIFFFGSRVSNTGNDRSDIDIGIEGSAKIPFSIMDAIKEDLDNLPVLYKIDLVDFKSASDVFKEVALQKIEPLL